MNNSQLSKVTSTLDRSADVDIQPELRKKQEELVETISALQSIAGSSPWKVLEENVFNDVLDGINKKLQESNDEKEMYRLQGQAAWAKKYCDLHALIRSYKIELEAITLRLHG